MERDIYPTESASPRYFGDEPKPILPEEPNPMEDSDLIKLGLIEPRFTISDAFRVYCRRTNGHGWNRIPRARTLKGTCFWFWLTFLSFTACSIYCIYLWSKYNDYAVETRVYGEIGRIPFPAVTICSVNPVSTKKINRGGVSYASYMEQAEANIRRTLSDTEYHTMKLNGEYLDIHFEAYQLLVKAGNATDVATRKTVGYDLNELILQCNFGGLPCDLTEGKHFKFVYNHAYGNCYTFNAGMVVNDNQKASHYAAAGVNYGLHLVLRVDNSEYLPWFTETEGIRIAIHEAATMPQPAIDGHFIGAGTAMEFGLGLTQYARLAPPYHSHCVNDFDSFQQRFGYKYSAKGCLETCLQRTTINECGCQDPRLQVAQGIEDCAEREPILSACLANANFIYRTTPEKYCDCPHSCSESTYQTVISRSDWPSMETESEVRAALGYSRKMATARIYFREPFYEIYTDVPVQTIWMFLGWLGGQLYMWTGASLLTLLEVFVFLAISSMIMFTENMDWMMVNRGESEVNYFPVD